MNTYVSCHVRGKKNSHQKMRLTWAMRNRGIIIIADAYAGLSTCLPVFSITYISSFILVTTWRHSKFCCCSSPWHQRLLIFGQTPDLHRNNPRDGKARFLTLSLGFSQIFINCPRNHLFMSLVPAPGLRAARSFLYFPHILIGIRLDINIPIHTETHAYTCYTLQS